MKLTKDLEIVLPKFKYHLNPEKSNIFENKNVKCSSCQKDVSIVYTGPLYSNEDVENICPWCIGDGSAAKKFDGEFIDSNSVESKINADVMEELFFRTPSYIAWQQPQWLVHCNEPCQFIGYVGSKEIENKKINVENDIILQAESYGLSPDEFKERLNNNGSLQGYLFKCIKCTEYRLTTDCD